MKRIGLIAILLLTIGLPCQASPREEPTPGPLKVTVGLYLNEILDLDFQGDFMVVDFWVWFRWEALGDGDGISSDYRPVEQIEIIDGRVTDKIGYRRERKGNTIYESVRIIAKITNRFKMKSYPLDSHMIMIRIEDQWQDRTKLEFAADAADSGVSQNVELPGWSITPFKPFIFIHSYKTHFGQVGQTNETDSEYSQFRFSLRLCKPLLISVFKALWATFLATSVAFLAILLNPKISSRFGLGVGALFTAVVAKISLASSVQSVSQFGFTDAVQLVSGLMILFSMIWSIRAYRRIEKGLDYESVIRKSDLRCTIVLFVAYITIVSILIFAYAPSP